MDINQWKKLIDKIDDKNTKEKAFYFSNLYMSVSVPLSICSLLCQGIRKINVTFLETLTNQFVAV